jgi:hypothetical protein
VTGCVEDRDTEWYPEFGADVMLVRDQSGGVRWRWDTQVFAKTMNRQIAR